jgi:hypothetical protein
VTRTPFIANARVADHPGMIVKANADLRDLPQGEPESGSFGNWRVIASDLAVDPCQRYDSEGAGLYIGRGILGRQSRRYRTNLYRWH